MSTTAPATDVVVRRMRWWDVEGAQIVETRVFQQTPWPPETFWSELAGVPASRHYLVAESRGQIVGYAGLMVVGREADIQTLAVAPESQRQGVGSRLLNSLLDEAGARDCARVTLEVAADSEAAQGLYLRRGFTVMARRSNYYGPGADALIMRIRLGRSGQPEGGSS